MRFGVVSLFPELIEQALGYGILARAVNTGLLDMAYANPRDWTDDRHRTVDDRPFGGGPGMVMKALPLVSAISSLKARLPDAKVVCLSPQGRLFDQAVAREWQSAGSLILVSGRYEGIDERVMEAAIDEEVSLGSFVLSGGEFAALAIIDAITRLEPGVLGCSLSAGEDSFGEDGLLDCPHYTRPEEVNGRTVPPVLLSGDHAAIARWRRQQALNRTRDRRPDLLETADLTRSDRDYLQHLDASGDVAGSSSSE